MTTETAFVAGATGFTGREVVRLLCERNIRCVAHIRPGSSAADTWGPRFTELGAKLDRAPWQADTLKKSIDQYAATIVFALLGTTNKRAKKERTAGSNSNYNTIDYGLTKMLIDACGDLSAVRFVYLSSAGVPKSEPSKGSYMNARFRIERDLRQVRREGFSFTCARPSIITGERDESRLGERVGARALDGALAALGAFGGKQMRDRYRSTTNTILASALIRHSLDPKSAGRSVESEDLR